MEPTTFRIGVGEKDDQVIFPVVNRTGESLILIDASRVEVVTVNEKSIIMRLKMPL
jgi:hypothetical protein